VAGTISALKEKLEPEPIERLLLPIDWFLRRSAAPGIMLIAATLMALVWANSPWGESYRDLFERTDFHIGLESWALNKPLVLWINDALMALFFLLVGLEIKREILVGQLSSPKKAALPIAAAVGGMAVPALIYAAFNWGQPTIRGWGIPMATDIAFVIGALALLGDRGPHGLRVFLVSVAIVDDLGALLVIAFVYTESVSQIQLAYAGAVLIGLFGMNRLGVRSFLPYLVLGAWLWFFVFSSGVHATIAGVLLAMTIPARGRADIPLFLTAANSNLDLIGRELSDGRSAAQSEMVRSTLHDLQRDCDLVLPPLHRLETRLHNWIVFIVLPVFALANAGVRVGGAGPGGGGTSVLLGTMLGLLIGKPIGIVAFSWLAVRARFGVLPRDLAWRHVVGAGVLAGIGFTMSLFIATLAFDGGPALEKAKIAILSASALATIAGLAVLWRKTVGMGESEE
jgi:NhaA family Na+:H+ antiporter